MGAAIAVAAANVNQWLKQECLETNAGIPYMATQPHAVSGEPRVRIPTALPCVNGQVVLTVKWLPARLFIFQTDSPDHAGVSFQTGCRPMRRARPATIESMPFDFLP
jgi:hypothetical protein